METQILIGYLLSILPFIELRGGLPLIVEHVIRNGGDIWPHFFIVVFLNSITTVFIFMFLDSFHEKFSGNKYYDKFAIPIIRRSRKKSVNFQRKFKDLGFIALVIFVSIPLPGTGVWSGSLISWILGLDQKKSIVAITFGVIIAALLVLLLSLGLFTGIYNF